MEPRWTRGAKDAVGTAYSTSSHIWYTLSGGCITEVYYPTIDRPQIRDLQFLVTDGETFFHDERRNMDSMVDCISEAALGFEMVNTSKTSDYVIRKTIIGDPHQNCLLIRTRLEAAPEVAKRLKLYVLCAPHLEIGGWNNNAEVMEMRAHRILVAHKGNTWMALNASAPFTKCSCGYVGVNDGWTDLSQNYHMDWDFDAALDGNVAMTGQIDLSKGLEFTIGLAFGESLHHVVSTLMQSLSVPFERSVANFVEQWDRTSRRFTLSSKLSCRESLLYERSINLLLAHEDKLYPGAMIASMSIPWGEDKGDDELGGYHLVWTRDMVNSASALLAAGDTATALRALIYLAVSQREDGGFYQNFWVDGQPYWSGSQLDEVSFPVLLAWRLFKAKALGNFDPTNTILRATGFLIREGPTTAQDRWEENSGYSPYTLAVNIAALVCAADYVRATGDAATADFIGEVADFLEAHIERWTVTTQGTLVPGISKHYIRINPTVKTHSSGVEDPNNGVLSLSNQPPNAVYEYPAKDIIDAGFLELVRYGVRKATDPIIQDSVEVVDKILKVDTPYGPCWRRYNHDGYGQKEDGSSYTGWGRGRAWPLLTGERGHYELAAGRSPELYLHSMEQFANGIGIIPEQVWDAPDLPMTLMRFGGPTGSAIPLLWAHGEYLKLLRSWVDGRVFDILQPVVDRYQSNKKRSSVPIEIWRLTRQIPYISPGTKLRIVTSEPFILHWTADEWAHKTESPSVEIVKLGLSYFDVQTQPRSKFPLRYSFYWANQKRWEEQEFRVDLQG